MISGLRWFNVYFIILPLVAAGCVTVKKKEVSTLRLHLEVNRDGTDRNGPVTIGRTDPFVVNVETQPFLTELNVASADVMDVLGGFQFLVQFDRQGTWLLEQYTTANLGRRVGIFSQFGEPRWIAAPLMQRRIADGLLVFTPDASREEADRIARGLKNVAKQVRKGNR